MALTDVSTTWAEVIIRVKWTISWWRFTVHLTLMMTSAQVVETSVNVTSNSPSQDYTHPDDHNLPNYDMTPRFKPFTVLVDKVNWPPQRDWKVTFRAFRSLRQSESSDMNPVDRTGAVSEIGASPLFPLSEFRFVQVRRRAGPITGISVFPTAISVSGLENFLIWTLQPSYRDEYFSTTICWLCKVAD